VALGLLAALPAMGQDETRSSPLEELLSTKVLIATGLIQREEEAPSIVSVVTHADIERYGWRDLTDILKALPGFDFGLDGTGLVGLSERGIWAHEGKALVMVDGISVTPLHNGNLNYYGFIPSAMVDRVEVIRGPGSAVYGQFAGVAVINVITRSADEPDGGRFTLRGTTLGAGTNGGGGFLSLGTHVSDTVDVSLNAGYQSDPFSRQPYEDTFFTHQAFPQDKGNSRRENTYISATVKALGTEVRLLRTVLHIAEVDGAGSGPLDPGIPGLPPGVPGAGERTVQGVRLKHGFALTDALTLEATGEGIENNMGVVYPQSRVGSGVFTSGDTRERDTGDLALKWTPDTSTTMLLGAGAIRDWERSVDLKGRGGLRDPADPSLLVPQITLTTRYLYAQFDGKAGDVGITAGGRYETNNLDHAFAPRLGLTWAPGSLNFKVLYGEAFRQPSIFQEYSTLYASNGNLVKAELIRSFELEAGWRINSNLKARLNLYRMAVTRTIEGAIDAAGGYFIENTGAIRSKGVEAQFDARYGAWGAFGNLSWTRPDGASVPFYLSGDASSFLGVSPVKINVGANLTLGPVQLGPTLLYASSRQVQTAASALSGTRPGSVLPVLIQSEALPGRLLLNLALTWNGCLGPGTTLRCVAGNVGNAAYPLAQPYYGAHAPLAANDRRLTADLAWTF
jgi:outer membrane cobalamin receptor